MKIYPQPRSGAVQKAYCQGFNNGYKRAIADINERLELTKSVLTDVTSIDFYKYINEKIGEK